jgi:SAM-dependent methyltransferase
LSALASIGHHSRMNTPSLHRRALLAALAVAPFARAFAQNAPEPVFGTPGKDAGWIPTPNEMVEAMLKMAKLSSADLLVDLGSGDGRIPILAAKEFGSRALGIELNSDLVAYSQQSATKAGLADKVKFVRGDIFETDFTDANVVTLFMPPVVLKRLRPKLLAMKPGTRIVSYLFNMEEWEPDAWAWNEGMHGMLWIIPASVAGRWTLASSAPDPQSYTVTLDQDFQKIDGRLLYSGAQLPLFDARLEGDDVRFTALVGARRHDFRGKVKGDSLEGSLHVTGEPERSFRGVRG